MGEHDGHRQRLRERFFEFGLVVFQDDQVLELLLFFAIPRQDTNAIARKLLKHFGSLSAVLEADSQELKAAGCVGEQASMLLQLIRPLARRYMLSCSEKGQLLNSTQACGEYLLPYFFGATEEQVYLLCLDARCRVLTCRLLQRGGINNASFSLRKVAETAIAAKASSVILAHNHTSGIALPSQADYVTTHQVQTTLDALDIMLADHIIVAGNDFVSMAETGGLNRF